MEKNVRQRTNQKPAQKKSHPPCPSATKRPQPLKRATINAEQTLTRLNKALAERGVCSRRHADTLIFEGKVSVNGVVETNPARRVAPCDVLQVDGAQVAKKAEEHVYLLLNKPIHTVCTVSDPENRTTILDLLPEQYAGMRLYPVGRLDYFSEGLLLITNDGSLAFSLTHPRFHLPKVYRVTIRGTVPSETLELLQKGMTLSSGEKLAPTPVTATKIGNNTLLTMTLFQGINRQIRRMCEDLSLTILRLIRISEGPLLLGDLPQGQVRSLTPSEVQALKKACTCPTQPRTRQKSSSSKKSFR